MTSQQHADVILGTWQRRRVLPPEMRLVDVPDDYEETLDVVREEMGRPSPVDAEVGVG